MKYDLDYWKSGEYQVIEEHLSDLTKAKTAWNPGKSRLYDSMTATPFDKVRVMIVGQDPYPNPMHATGVAFSIPSTVDEWPPTLSNILSEYSSDLRLPKPECGDLSKWTEQGVFLWNVIPSCTTFTSMSHHWEEWYPLTEEILTKLSNQDKYIVFVFLGSLARSFSKFVNKDECDVIETSHPSPRGSINSKTPFKGSRMFSSINDLLCSHGEKAINWRL